MKIKLSVKEHPKILHQRIEDINKRNYAFEKKMQAEWKRIMDGFWMKYWKGE